MFLGRDYADHQDYSEETARRIDVEVQRIMREAHRRAEEILLARRDQLELMKQVLLERETVEGEAVEALLDGTWDAYLEREKAGGTGAAPQSTGAPSSLSSQAAHERRGDCGRRGPLCCGNGSKRGKRRQQSSAA